MGKFYVPTFNEKDWRKLFAFPEKHWIAGSSARALAFCWEEAKGFPQEIQDLFVGTELHDIEFLIGIPEHHVALPGGTTKSQNDVFVLAKSGQNLVAITIEGKVNEPFGPTLGEWFVNASHGKITRLDYLKKNIGLSIHIESSIRFQFLHRVASAVIEAKRFNASYAAMIVHSFSQENAWFEDYQRFVGLYGTEANINVLTHVAMVDGIKLFIGWAKGSASYLKK